MKSTSSPPPQHTHSHAARKLEGDWWGSVSQGVPCSWAWMLPQGGRDAPGMDKSPRNEGSQPPRFLSLPASTTLVLLNSRSCQGHAFNDKSTNGPEGRGSWLHIMQASLHITHHL